MGKFFSVLFVAALFRPVFADEFSVETFRDEARLAIQKLGPTGLRQTVLQYQKRGVTLPKILEAYALERLEGNPVIVQIPVYEDPTDQRQMNALVTSLNKQSEQMGIRHIRFEAVLDKESAFDNPNPRAQDKAQDLRWRRVRAFAGPAVSFAPALIPIWHQTGFQGVVSTFTNSQNLIDHLPVLVAAGVGAVLEAQFAIYTKWWNEKGWSLPFPRNFIAGLLVNVNFPLLVVNAAVATELVLDLAGLRHGDFYHPSWQSFFVATGIGLFQTLTNAAFFVGSFGMGQMAAGHLKKQGEITEFSRARFESLLFYVCKIAQMSVLLSGGQSKELALVGSIVLAGLATTVTAPLWSKILLFDRLANQSIKRGFDEEKAGALSSLSQLCTRIPKLYLMRR